MKKSILFILAIIVSISAVLAQNSNIKLLAVSGEGENQTGSVVDLTLEVISGQGRIFIDSKPLTKIDTQVSTRIANRYACDYVNIDCSKLDFIYTIRSGSPIIGGPSASAAIAALTISKLSNKDIDNSVALTGTLTSGGMIGVVGGVKEKVLAAKKNGLKKVLIPKGSKSDDNYFPKLDLNNSNSSQDDEDQNITNKFEIPSMNWTQFGIDNKIEVVEVVTISDVLIEFGVIDAQIGKQDIDVDSNYEVKMKSLAEELCYNANELKEKFNDSNLTSDADLLLDRGLLFKSMNEYYSSASQCFASLTRYRYHDFKLKNMTESDINQTIDELSDEITSYVIPEYETITDIVVYVVVNERLKDAIESLDEARIQKNDTQLNTLAYAKERFNTAKSWANFIDHQGSKFQKEGQDLKEACKLMVSEADELVQYVDFYFPAELFSLSRNTLDDARESYLKNDYPSCLFLGAKAKSESNLMLTSLGVETSHLKSVVNSKIKAIEEVLLKSAEFPVVGYSYYEYAKALNSVNDSSSALLYAEYALELSNLNIYFSNDDKKKELYIEEESNDYVPFITFVLGLVLGILISIFFALIIIEDIKAKKKRRSKRK